MVNLGLSKVVHILVDAMSEFIEADFALRIVSGNHFSTFEKDPSFFHWDQGICVIRTSKNPCFPISYPMSTSETQVVYQLPCFHFPD